MSPRDGRPTVVGPPHQAAGAGPGPVQPDHRPTRRRPVGAEPQACLTGSLTPGGTGTRGEDWAARAEAGEGTGAPAPCEDGGSSPEAAGGGCTLGRVQESPGSGMPAGLGPLRGLRSTWKHVQTDGASWRHLGWAGRRYSLSDDDKIFVSRLGYKADVFTNQINGLCGKKSRQTSLAKSLCHRV